MTIDSVRQFLSAGRRLGFVRAVSRLRRDRRGNFTILFALTVPLLVILVGMGVDFSIALSDKSRLDLAADAAALAAVNTAKSWYAANSGSGLSESALESGAESAGQTQGQAVFNANVGSTVLVSAPTLTLPLPGYKSTTMTFTASVNWTAQVTAHFGPLVGISTFNISGNAQAQAGLPKYLDFYVVVDTSGSMGIPTSATDQETLIANNPDNAQEEANGYAGGCQFACHFPGYQGFVYTQENNIQIPLKLNSVNSAVKALLSTATATKVIANQFRIGIYPFIVDPIQAAALSSDFTSTGVGSVTYAANNLANDLDAGSETNGVINQGMGSGGTHFETLWSGMSPYLQTPGTGTSSSSTQPYIILVTDGVDNSQTYTPSTYSWSGGSQPQVPSLAFCTSAKAAGYTVAVLLIPYDPIVDPETIWNDEDGVVNSLISTNSITPAMQSCASSGYFFSAATAADITSAMQTIFYQAVQAARLTQ